jgi:hypothetical protein
VKPRLSAVDINQAAQAHGIEGKALRAVITVESAGTGFLPDGRLKILFERHILWRRLSIPGRDVDPALLAQDHPELCGPTWNPQRYPYGSEAYQWVRFDQVQAWAAKRDPQRAQSYLKATCEACSWGLLQVLGQGYAAAGFSDVLTFRAAMEESELRQLLAALRWMETNGLLPALKAKDWIEFARRYNGTANVKVYAARLEAAYWKGIAG